jgi:hypothetical protein
MWRRSDPPPAVRDRWRRRRRFWPCSLSALADCPVGSVLLVTREGVCRLALEAEVFAGEVPGAWSRSGSWYPGTRAP